MRGYLSSGLRAPSQVLIIAPYQETASFDTRCHRSQGYLQVCY